MTFCYDIDPHVVKVIRNSLENGTDMSINVRAKGDARVFWASDWDIEQKNLDTRFEVQFGHSEYTIRGMKRNVVILNQADKSQQGATEARMSDNSHMNVLFDPNATRLETVTEEAVKS